jgi:hypothetical protein
MRENKKRKLLRFFFRYRGFSLIMGAPVVNKGKFKTAKAVIKRLSQTKKPQRIEAFYLDALSVV